MDRQSLFRIKERRWIGWMGRDGDVVIEPRYRHASEFGERLAPVSWDAYVARHGCFKFGLAEVQTENRRGHLSREGRWVWWRQVRESL